MARKKRRWFLGIFQPTESEADPEIPILQGRKKRRWGTEGMHVCLCALGVGILKEIFRNMMVTVTTGKKGLIICMTGSTKKKSSPITRTRRDQTLSVTQLALFQMYTRRQSSYITMFKRTPLVWALCICTRCGIKLVYIEDFHLSMLLFLKTILSVVNSLCYKESRTVNFIIVSQYREKGIKLKYKMTYQICLTGTNSLWSIPHHNFIGRQTIHIYRSGSRLLLFCL